MVDANAHNGTYTKNPFYFKNYNTTFLGLTVNDLPGKPFQLEFAAAGGTNYVSAYQTLYAPGSTRCFGMKAAVALPETSMPMATQCTFLI